MTLLNLIEALYIFRERWHWHSKIMADQPTPPNIPPLSAPQRFPTILPIRPSELQRFFSWRLAVAGKACTRDFTTSTGWIIPRRKNGVILMNLQWNQVLLMKNPGELLIHFCQTSNFTTSGVNTTRIRGVSHDIFMIFFVGAKNSRFGIPLGTKASLEVEADQTWAWRTKRSLLG